VLCGECVGVFRHNTPPPAFATPKRSYHFLRELSLQNQKTFSICLKQEKDNPSPHEVSTEPRFNNSYN